MYPAMLRTYTPLYTPNFAERVHPFARSNQASLNRGDERDGEER